MNTGINHVKALAYKPASTFYSGGKDEQNFSLVLMNIQCIRTVICSALCTGLQLVELTLKAYITIKRNLAVIREKPRDRKSMKWCLSLET